MEKLGQFLGIIDYLVIAGSLIFCTCFGIFYKGKSPKSNSISEYFLGSRQMGVLPIAISMVATSLSAVPIVSGVGEMYLYGVEYAISPITIQFGKIVSVFLIVPVFRYMDYVSIYQYLENRFDRSVRLGFAFVYILLNVFQISVALYLPSLLLATVTGFPYWITSTISGILCTLYCVLGGFKAVIWTDVIQFIFMFSSLIIIILTGTVTAGGPNVVLREGIRKGFLENLQWFDTEDKRFTVISSTIYGLFLGIQTCSTSQAVAQRLLSVPNIKAAQRAVMVTAVIGLAFMLCIIGVAAILYTNFHLCDPIQLHHVSGVTSPDLMLLYFLQKFFADYPGFSGIAFAGILSSSLSTISSYINSFAAITLEDFVKPYYSIKKNNEAREILISKATTAFYGLLVILLSFVIPHLGGVIKAFTSVMGALGGPLTALMCLGIFVQRVKKRASMVGLLAGIAFCLWLVVGSQTSKTNYRHLPLSTEGCPVEWENATVALFNSTLIHPLEVTKVENTEAPNQIFPLYRLSFVWYGPIGFVLTMIVAIITSYIIREKQDYIDPRLLSPLVTRSHFSTSIPLSEIPQIEITYAVKRNLLDPEKQQKGEE